MTTTEIPQWVRDYVDACNRHDASQVVEQMTDDIHVVDTAFGGDFVGRDQVRELVAGMDSGLSSDFRFTVKTVIESGDDYAFEWVLEGTQDRANAQIGIPATGKHFAVPGLTIGRRRDGRIAENRDYWNVAGLLAQIGLLTPPGN